MFKSCLDGRNSASVAKGLSRILNNNLDNKFKDCQDKDGKKTFCIHGRTENPLTWYAIPNVKCLFHDFGQTINKLSVVHYSVLCWNSSRVISLWSIPSFISICEIQIQPHIHFGLLAKCVKAIHENGLVYEKPLDTFLAALSEDDLS